VHQYIVADIMKKFLFIIKIFIVYLFITSIGITKQLNYFSKGVLLFENEEFDKSKIFFERDIVFNPKSEKSYLYLAKIFNEKNNDQEQEINLNSVLLINPQNDEAIYMLTLLKIKQYDYNQAKELINTFNLVCKSLCSKQSEIKKKLKKINPEHAKDNN
tara:strand:- start:192 stop:668 length:477 start_codon:yes stop_codon:yes gene_type:complete